MIGSSAKIDGVSMGRKGLPGCQPAASAPMKHPLSTGHSLRIKEYKPGVTGMECMDLPPVMERGQQ